MAEKLEDIVKIGSVNLGDNPPNPEKIRDEDLEFITLENEIDKIGGLQADSIAWHKVIDASTLILREKSKDFKVVSCLCFALFKRDKYQGLSVGLTVLRDMLEQHWDIAYPPKQKSKERLRELAWLGGQLERILPDQNSDLPKPMYQNAIIECNELLAKINTLLDEKIGQNGVNVLSTIRETFQTYQQRFENLKKAQPAPKKVEDKKPEKTITAKTLQANLFEIAEEQRKQDISNPVPYRILRFSAWLFIEKIPNHDKNSIFPVAGPTVNVPKPHKEMGDYEELLENGEYVELINKAEETFAKSTAPPISPHCYWLDAHRFTAKALEALKADTAKQAVIEGLVLFLQRLPGIQELRYNNGVAFADDKTKLWLQDEVLVTQSDPQETPTDATVIPAWITAAKNARQLAVNNQFEAGLKLLHEGAQQATTSRREQFYWWLEQARFYYDTQKIAFAIPQLEFLEQQVQQFSLEEWEPRLSIEVARLLLLCHKKLTSDGKTYESQKLPHQTTTDTQETIIAEKHKYLYARLCRLDMLAALEVVKK